MIHRDMRHRLRIGRWSLGAGVISGVVVALLIGGGAIVYARLGGSFSATTSSVDLQKGLVGWWRLDGDAKDATPYGNNGTVVSGTLTTDRKGAAGRAYVFGGNGYIQATLPVSSNMLFATSGISWSVSMWFKSTSSATNIMMLGRAGGVGASGTYGLYLSGGNLKTVLRGVVSTLGAGYNDNQWHLASITWDGTNANAYIDGSDAIAVSVGTASLQNYANFCIGAAKSDCSSNWFDGSIDNVRLYNRALSAAETKALYTQYDAEIRLASSQVGLVGWWKLDSNAKDSTPYSNNGSIVGTTPVSDRKGLAGSAYSFNGSSNYVALGNSSSEQLSVGTVSAWVKSSSPGSSYRGIVVKQYAYSLFLIDGVLGFYDWSASTPRSTGVNLADGAWHHVAVSFSSGVGGGTNVYVDGVAVLTTTLTIANQTKGLVLGAGVDTGDIQNINASIDDVRLYKRVLTSAEIASLYNSYNRHLYIH